jgi:hypothetical protein
MAPLARHQAVFEPKFATGFNYSRVMAFNKPRTLQGEIAALEREVDQHRRDMAEVEGNDGVAHGNVSDWLITSGRTLIDKGDELLSLLTLDPDFGKHRDAFMRELKTFRKFYKKWAEKNSAE